MSLYNSLLNKAYNNYVDAWCRVRGYRRSLINPLIGANGECYACRDEFEDREFADPYIVVQYLTDAEYEQYKLIMGVSN